MNAVLVPVLLIFSAVLLLAWFLCATTYRSHPWAVAGWLPVTGIACLGTLACGGLLLESCSLGRGGGAANGFAAAGLARGVVLFLPCPLFLGLCLRLHPRKPISLGASAVGFVVLGGAVAFGYQAIQALK